MVYITGDTHGDFSRFKCAAARKLKKEDTLIVLGDFGFLWHGGKREQKILSKISKLRYAVLFLDGVNENYEMLDALPEQTAYGGTVRIVSDNVYYLQRGVIYTIEGKTFFAFGGGGTDEDAPFISSLPTEPQITQAREALRRAGGHVDYIITHEPSQKIGGYLNRNRKLTGTSIFLTLVENTTEYKHWYFGSLHMDKAISKNHRSLFNDIVPVD